MRGTCGWEALPVLCVTQASFPWRVVLYLYEESKSSNQSQCEWRMAKCGLIYCLECGGPWVQSRRLSPVVPYKGSTQKISNPTYLGTEMR